jgi:hypothetical protein
MAEYLPIPARVWSRVQNPCVYNLLPSNSNTAYIPLTNQTVSLARANYQEKLLYKGNILQHKKNSFPMSKKQKYTQIAKGLGPNRKKVYATQSQTYTNPNTTGLLRVNSIEIPFPNEIVGAPNNISGPYQYNVPNPFDCPSNSLQDGGNLVCGTYTNPCTGEIIESSVTSADIYTPSYCSDVPGAPIELYWNKKVQSWFPRQRYTMNNSGDKWPQGYKGFVSAVRPKPPVISLVYETDDIIEISWAVVTSDCLPISSFNVYINNTFYINIKNTRDKLYLQTIDKNFVRDLLGNALTDNYDFNIHITSLTRDQESLPSKMVNKVDGPYGSTELPNTYESLSSNFLYFKATHGVVLPPVPSDGCDCNYFNKLFKDNTIVQINTWLTNYNDNINVNTHTRIDLDTYNDYNVNLEKLKKSMDPTCCFYGLLSIYEDIWKTLWASYNQKYDYYDLVTNSSRWKEDSNILNNSVLLKDYIKKLESTVAPLISITVTQKNLCVKPRYSRYFELYGIPENLEFDPEKMMQIDLELSLENNDECLEAVSTDCSAYNSETDCCD